MVEASIPVDLFNPGQVFACVGFAEAVDVLLGDAEGWFDWSTRDAVRFRLRACGEDNPVERVLRFLSQATVSAEAPRASANISAWRSAWGPNPHELADGQPYPIAEPESPEKLCAVMRAGTYEIQVHHWGDTSRRDPFKLWAGSGGLPGPTRLQRAVDLIKGACLDACADPFAMGVPQSSAFGLDWRRDYIPIDAGFSLNQHKETMTSVGYPLVEILGAIGLGGARPEFLERFEYRYAVPGHARLDHATWLPLSFLRAGLGGIALPFAARRFRMFLAKPGDESKSRAITQVTEESES